MTNEEIELCARNMSISLKGRFRPDELQGPARAFLALCEPEYEQDPRRLRLSRAAMLSLLATDHGDEEEAEEWVRLFLKMLFEIRPITSRC